jgi:competence protein ComGC
MFCYVNREFERNKPRAATVTVAMSTLAAGTRSLLPALLLILIVGVLVLVVLPAILAVAGGAAT